VAWAKLAEICRDHLKKGMLVYVEGYLKTRSWDMEDGTRRFRTEIVLQDMIILEKRKNDEGDDYMMEPGDIQEEAPMMGNEMPGAPAASEAASQDSAPSNGAMAANIDDDNMF